MDYESLSNADLQRVKEELEAKHREVEQALAKRRRSLIRDLRKETQQKCDELGITLAELVGTGGPTDKRTVVKPQYRDAKSGKTWSGRGTLPAWLKAAVSVNGKLPEGDALEKAIAAYRI